MNADESPCFRCGYDLQTIADDRPCPECGLLAGRSRRASDELRDSRPLWLRTLFRGAGRILLALIILVIWPFIFAWVGQQWWRDMGYFYWFARASAVERYLIRAVVPMFGVLLSVYCFAAGVISLTAPEGYRPADHADRNRRRFLRALLIVPTATMFLMLHSLFNGSSWKNSPYTLIVPLLTVGCAPIPLLLMLQLRSLAKRARSAHLAEHCLIVGLGVSAGLLYTGIVTELETWQERLGLGANWSDRSNYWLALMLVVSVAAILFALWGFYLLMRFTIAFGRAASHARRGWVGNDLSLNVTPTAPTIGSPVGSKI